MKVYTEGFYAVNGNRMVVTATGELTAPDSATVETFSNLASLDKAYPPVKDNNLGGLDVHAA